jgi:alpha-tubulin suppressor-like RCC1 family protein
VYSGSSVSVNYWENIEIDIPKFITVLKPVQNLGELLKKDQWKLSKDLSFHKQKQEVPIKAKWMVTGDNDYGQLMLGHKNTPVTTWTEMKPPVPFVSIASAYHTIGVAENGDIYSCGYNHYGQVGNGNTNEVINPIKINLPEPVICVSVNLQHSAVVTSNRILIY